MADNQDIDKTYISDPILEAARKKAKKAEAEREASMPTFDQLPPSGGEEAAKVGTTHAAESARAMEEGDDARENRMRKAMGLPEEP